MRSRCYVFILGAGFSRPAGLPLAVELWQEVRERAERMSGRAEKFRDDLGAYLRYQQDCNGCVMSAADVDFEDFLAFLDVEFYLNIRGSQTWSEDGNETQVLVKTLIAQILTERTPMPSKLPEVYRRFAEHLQPNDTLVTFNYDTLLERALTQTGKPFRLFPSRYKSIEDATAEVEYSQKEIKILKLHGSVDWFDRKRYRHLVELRSARGFGPPEDPIFNRPEIQVTPIVDGPRFPGDPLLEMHRVLNAEALFSKPPLFIATPWLLNPSSMKLLFSTPVKDFWGEIGRDGLANLGMAIIGYSLPPHDDYARQVIYRLVKNYQAPDWQELLGQTKAPLVVIDYRQSNREMSDLKERYRFVDWTRTQCSFDGFDEDVLPLLFPG